MPLPLGYRHSEETKHKIAARATGRRHTDTTKLKLSLHFKGKPIKEETRLKIQATMKAKFAGLAPNPRRELLRKIRKSQNYQNWRIAVLELHSYECDLCGDTDRSRLTFPELALDVSNGRVLCSICHLTLPTHGVASRMHETTDATH